MSKFHSLTLGGVWLLGALAAWQFMENSELKEANAALRHQVQEVSVRAMGAVVSSGGMDAKPAGDKETPARETAGVADQTPEQAALAAQFKKMRMMDRVQRHDAKILTLTAKLNLSAEQQAAVRAALEKSSAARDAIRDAADERRRAGKVVTEEQRQADRATVAAIELPRSKVSSPACQRTNWRPTRNIKPNRNKLRWRAGPISSWETWPTNFL